jgi:hypothetical protein
MRFILLREMFYSPDIFLLWVKVVPSLAVDPALLIRRNVRELPFILSLIGTLLLLLLLLLWCFDTHKILKELICHLAIPFITRYTYQL